MLQAVGGLLVLEFQAAEALVLLRVQQAEGLQGAEVLAGGVVLVEGETGAGAGDGPFGAEGAAAPGLAAGGNLASLLVFPRVDVVSICPGLAAGGNAVGVGDDEVVGASPTARPRTARAKSNSSTRRNGSGRCARTSARRTANSRARTSAASATRTLPSRKPSSRRSSPTRHSATGRSRSSDHYGCTAGSRRRPSNHCASPPVTKISGRSYTSDSANPFSPTSPL
jgi:hypothetical protein